MAFLYLSRPVARWHRALLAATCVGVLAGSGCVSDPEVVTHLSEYVPFVVNDIDTDVIFPRPQGGASRFLVRNWPPQRTLEGDTMWVHGKWAQVRFFRVAEGAASFLFEAAPYAITDAPQQAVTVEVNGDIVDTLPMRPGWQTYEVALPTEALEIGWNDLQLRFAHNPRPVDLDPRSSERRTMAAEVTCPPIVGSV